MISFFNNAPASRHFAWCLRVCDDCTRTAVRSAESFTDLEAGSRNAIAVSLFVVIVRPWPVLPLVTWPIISNRKVSVIISIVIASVGISIRCFLPRQHDLKGRLSGQFSGHKWPSAILIPLTTQLRWPKLWLAQVRSKPAGVAATSDRDYVLA